MTTIDKDKIMNNKEGLTTTTTELIIIIEMKEMTVIKKNITMKEKKEIITETAVVENPIPDSAEEEVLEAEAAEEEVDNEI